MSFGKQAAGDGAGRMLHEIIAEWKEAVAAQDTGVLGTDGKKQRRGLSR